MHENQSFNSFYQWYGPRFYSKKSFSFLNYYTNCFLFFFYFQTTSPCILTSLMYLKTLLETHKKNRINHPIWWKLIRASQLTNKISLLVVCCWRSGLSAFAIKMLFSTLIWEGCRPGTRPENNNEETKISKNID